MGKNWVWERDNDILFGWGISHFLFAQFTFHGNENILLRTGLRDSSWCSNPAGSGQCDIV